MAGIVSYGVYLPYWRLDRKRIGESLRSPAGRGTRSVASYDEDATTMGVEASRAALRATPDGVAPASLILSTATPAYLDKTNATAIHAALDLPAETPAVDMLGSVRSGVGALRAALQSPTPTLAVLSDLRSGLPGGADERDGGDAAVAILTAPDGPVIAEYLGGASATGEFLERWRVPGDPASKVWEERFGEHVYVPLAERAITDAVKTSAITPDAIDHLVVTGLHSRAVRRVAASSGARPEALVDDLSSVVGNTGVAHPALLLAAALERAQPDQTIAIVVLADGADVLLFRTTAALAGYRPTATIQDQIASTRDDLDYTRFLSWRGMLRREPPRRPDPTPPEAPPSSRSEDWKFAFVASRCEACGRRHMPPQRVCAGCHALDRMRAERMADVPATIATYTIDRLAYSESPPIVFGVLDFDEGGRYRCELTDVDEDSVAIGNRVEMTFRRLFQANGITNYFWKARPQRGSD
jgi:hydroxymethylglutaryl-CoA synthase